MNTPPLMDMMRELVAIPSVSSVSPEFDQGNLDLVQHMLPWLDDLGFEVETQRLDGEPAKANLVATLKPETPDGSGGLILSGHTDTVPYDAGRWDSDPFELVERNGALHGLGISDMKGFLAIAIEASRQFHPSRLRAPITLVATADEESSMSGGRALDQLALPEGAVCIIGEPTSLRPVRMHKGILMESLRLIGRSGHSSDPSLGNSALEGMQKAMAALLAWRAEMQGRYRNGAFTVPVPTLNLGRIQGGDNPNRICPECELTFDMRFLPGMPLDELRAGFRERVNTVLSNSGLGIEWSALFGGVEAFETPADAPIVRACEDILGHEAQAVAFATEGPFYTALGIDTVILGPGDIGCAHQPNEHLALDRIAPTLDTLTRLIERFCLR
ncbi:MAG: acetylornithine deacetylase [Gammaproteobacteria bacterium]